MLHPGVAGIPHDRQHPGPSVRAMETSEELECP
jgi:hypothetical protein